MFSKYKTKLLLKKTKKNLRTRKRSQINDRMQTIGFVIDAAVVANVETLLKIATSLQVKAVHQFYLVVLPYQKNMPDLLPNQMHSKQISWNGSLTNDAAKQFLNKDVDVLIACYKTPQAQMDYLVSASKAKFKIGLQGADTQLFDLILNVPVSESTLIEKEMKKYLKILNKI